MTRRTLIFALPLWLMFVAATFAQTTAPTTQAIALDQTTPRGTVKLFFAAEAASDGHAFKAIILTTSPAQDRMVDAIADKTDADRELTASILSKFPDAWKDATTGKSTDPSKKGLDALPIILSNVDQAIELIDGDTAKVQMLNSQAIPLTLKQSNGKWFMPLDAFVQGVQPDDTLDQNAHQIEIQVKVMRAGIADVSAGKYKTAADAFSDIKQKMFTAALDDHAATTQTAKP